MMPSNNEADVRLWCTGYLVTALRRPADRIDPDADFASLGMDSAEMLFLVTALEDRWGLDLPSDLPLDHPSVAALSRHIAALLLAKPQA